MPLVAISIQTAAGVFVAGEAGSSLAERPAGHDGSRLTSPQEGHQAGDSGQAAEASHGGGHEHGGLLSYPLKTLEQSTGLAIPEYAAWGWVITILLAIVCRKAGAALRSAPERNLAGFLELCVSGISGMARDFIGHGYEKHVPFIGTAFIFILCCNLSGLVPMVISPTGAMGGNAETYGLHTTIALALCAFVYVQYWGFRQNGLKYLSHFVGEPIWLFWLNIPIHIIGELARPLSLSLRLFGNIGGEDKILFVLGTMGILTIPLYWPLSLFAVFTGFLQAFVFTGLVCAYLEGVTPHVSEGEGH